MTLCSGARYPDELPDLGLTEDERRALQLAAAAVHVGASGVEEALWKLGTEGIEGVDGSSGQIANVPSPPVS